MVKIVRGYCPTQDTDYSVAITYVDASTLQESCHIKGTFRCKYNLYGDKCDSPNECPIYASAPQSL